MTKSAQTNPMKNRTAVVANGITIGLMERPNRVDQILLRQQRQSLNVPGQMVDSTGSSEYGGLPRSEGQPNQIVSGDFEAGFSIGRDAHDATLPTLRRGNVEIAVNVKS